MSGLLGSSIVGAGPSPALGDTTEVVTYRELDERACLVAASLRKIGLCPDEPVILDIGDRISDVVSLFGIWRAGGVAVPIHERTSGPVRSVVVRRTSARVRIPSGPLQAPYVDGPPPAHEPLLKDAALVVFTSGSTGLPKGVVLGHAVFDAKLSAIDQVLPFNSDTRTLLVLPLGFSFGQWVCLLTLRRGGYVHLHGKFSPKRAIRDVAEHGLNVVAAVPSMLRTLRVAHQALSSWRDHDLPTLLISGGEPLPVTLGRWYRDQLPATRIADVYGLTETSTSDLILPPRAYDSHAGSVGWPCPGVQTRIVGHGGAPVAHGDFGELQLRTPFLMQGYLGDPERTAASMDGAWFRTGDVACVSEHGTIRLAGRLSDIIIRGGHMVPPREVEEVLGEHPAVAEVLVVGLPSDLYGQEIAALVVPADPASVPTSAELQSWSRERLDPRKVPDRVHIGDKLPRGPTGKADRQALRIFFERQD